jgi:hypothetical protein
MPKYKATVVLKSEGASRPETVNIVIDANNAIHAKELLTDQYGEGSVKDVKRNDTPPKYVRASR